MSYASASIALDDNERFPNFFRTYPSDAKFGPIIVAIVKKFEWKRIAILTEDEDMFVGVR